MNDFYQKYLQEKMKMPTPSEVVEQGKNFQGAMFGATTNPLSNGAIMFAQKLANRGKNPYVSPNEFNSLMSVVERNLKLPKEMTRHPDINKLLQEILGSSERGKFNLKKIL